MSATISLSQNKLIEDLLANGRFQNKSEIIRHGLELVKQEVERESLRPFTKQELKAIYKPVSAQELAEEQRMARASAPPSIKEIEALDL